MCTGLYAGIDGANHSVGERRREIEERGIGGSEDGGEGMGDEEDEGTRQET